MENMKLSVARSMVQTLLMVCKNDEKVSFILLAIDVLITLHIEDKEPSKEAQDILIEACGLLNDIAIKFATEAVDVHSTSH
jgi:pentose-5-phosphate-3-epimerase